MSADKLWALNLKTNSVGDMIAHYLHELYKDDREMEKALKKMFEGNPIILWR